MNKTDNKTRGGASRVNVGHPSFRRLQPSKQHIAYSKSRPRNKPGPLQESGKQESGNMRSIPPTAPSSATSGNTHLWHRQHLINRHAGNQVGR